jgi:2-keto-4-pentenoate hydratase
MTHPLTDLLLAHRSSGVLLDSLPDALVPKDAATAYLVQTETVQALGPAGAWKVQPFPQSGEPFTSPILSSTVYRNGAALKLADYAGIALEAEIAVTVGRDLPAKPGGYTSAELRDAVASLHLAIEIVASRFLDRTKMPSLVGIADLQNSGAIIVGAATPADIWPELGQQQIAMVFDGVEVQSTAGNGTTENTLSSLAWLATHAAARGLPLKLGDVIITGARLGPLAFNGRTASVTGQAFAPVSCTFS